MQRSLLFVGIFAVPLLVSCRKIGGNDGDAPPEAGVAVPVATAASSAAPSAIAEPSASAARDPRGCKPGQIFAKLTEVPGGIESQKCRQICGSGLGQCPLGQSCTGSTTARGPLVCVNVRPAAGACKPGDRPVQGSAATLFSCVTPCKADADCPKQRPSCGRELVDDADNAALKFRMCTEQATPSTAASAPEIRPPNSALNTPTPGTATPPAKVKCVLPSPPPCAAPHIASPKGLCQLPCSNGSCAACGGTCQNGFCAGG